MNLNPESSLKAFLFLLIMLTAAPATVFAQQADTAAADSGSVAEPPRARDAMIKSMLVPGWGQASVGATRRGGVFFAIQSTSWYMLLRTIGRLGEAKQIEDAQADLVGDSLRLAMEDDEALREALSEPGAFEAAVEEAERVVDARGLVDARRQQRQDWIAYTLFFTFASAVDAYVAAQLSDFPVELDTGRRADGSISVGARVPLGNR